MTLRCSLHPGYIRAGVGLGQAVAGQLGPLGLRHQILLLLLLGAPLQQGQRIKAGVNAEHHPQKGVDALQLFADHRQRQIVHTCAAVLLGNADAQKAQLAHALQDRPDMGHVRVVLRALTIPVANKGLNLALRKLPHSLPQQLMLLVQEHIVVSSKIHVYAPR